jgi:hypothetical protein
MKVKKTRALRERFFRRIFGMLSKPGALLIFRFLIIFLISQGDGKIDASKLNSLFSNTEHPSSKMSSRGMTLYYYALLRIWMLWLQPFRVL